MFNNLVESSKHTEDFKRKGSFFLVTSLMYSLFLFGAGIASVVAYDAHLDNQSLELVALLSPVPLEKQPEVIKKDEPKPAKSNQQQAASRTELIARTDTSTKIPEKVSSTPSNIPEVPRSGVVVIGTTNSDPIGTPAGPSNNNSIGSDTVSTNRPLVINDTPPPVVKTEEPVKQPTMISKGVINGEARHLQVPAYPTLAKNAGVKGTVKVQILIDESGKVVSASVVSGHPFLKNAAAQAALQSSFTPTKLSGVPVKVSGFIVYNFN